MTRMAIGLALFALTAPAGANNWQKYYEQARDISNVEYSTTPPEVIRSSGNPQADRFEMWRRGYTLVGYSSFTSSNTSVKDALRWAAKLKVYYVVLNTDYNSSTTTSMTLTVPTQTMSTTNGTINVNGSGGSATGSYAGTTTTYGSKSTSYPLTVNWYDKFGAYYARARAKGVGILTRDFTPEEVSKYETRHGFVIQAVRDGSPADKANLLPGDVVLRFNGQSSDMPDFVAAVAKGSRLTLSLMRKGEPREIELLIPEEWRPG